MSNSRAVPITAPALEATMRRFWAKVALPNENGCLLWAAGTSGKGYGAFDHGGRTVKAHRFVYAALVGPIPEGLELDHLCRDRRCVAPDHLEPVTGAENTRRGNAGALQAARTCCPQGHPYSGENLYVSPDGDRHCLTCKRARNRAYMARKRDYQKGR